MKTTILKSNSSEFGYALMKYLNQDTPNFVKHLCYIKQTNLLFGYAMDFTEVIR
jgi:hypothetical protein